MARAARLITVAAILVAGLAAGLATALRAETRGVPRNEAEAAADPDEDTPTPAPLTVGAMAIASDAALVVQTMRVDVAPERVTYAYRFRNRGATPLALAASVTLPDLEVNTEGTTIHHLPSPEADNPVHLAVTSNGAPIATQPHLQALALGIDRLATLEAERLPLVPFGEETEKALAALGPEALGKLVDLGLATPRDPSEPDTPAIADWTLHNVHSLTLPLTPNAVTDVEVSFAPIKAVYTVSAAGLPGFEALKHQVCLTPAIMAAAKALLNGPKATLDVVDITLANEGPVRWLDNPPATIAVRKPKPDAVVAFCGMAASAPDQPVVGGTMPGSADAPGLRVLIFSSR